MAARTIPQRELRNNIAEILREAEAGAEFTITVRGRPVARLGPPDDEQRRVDVAVETLRVKLGATPVDPDLAADLAELRQLEAPAEGPEPAG
jgi:prevent-host-death family protein